MSDAGALDAAAIGERSAGQGCPCFGIQFESHRIHLLVIDKQDSFVGNNLVPGDPRGQAPGIICTLGRYTTGHVFIIRVFFQAAFLQSGSGQQSFVAVQLHLYAFFKCNVLQINGYGILQIAAFMRNNGALDAAVAFCRCDSGQGADHDQSQHHCK